MKISNVQCKYKEAELHIGGQQSLKMYRKIGTNQIVVITKYFKMHDFCHLSSSLLVSNIFCDARALFYNEEYMHYFFIFFLKYVSQMC